MNPDETRAAVRRGADFLDEKRPGWYNEINLSTLNQENSTTCVIGQLFGAYWSGLNGLDIGDGDARRYGFFCVKYENYKPATEQWVYEAHRRRLEHGQERVAEAPVPEPVVETPVLEVSDKVQVTQAQVNLALDNIKRGIAQHDSYVTGLTESGILLHVLMDLGIKVEVV